MALTEKEIENAIEIMELEKKHRYKIEDKITLYMVYGGYVFLTLISIYLFLN